MANPSLTVKIGADTTQLQAAMKLSGERVLAQANALTAAYQDLSARGIGLTDREQKKLNATLTEALAKYKAMGQEAPRAMREIADATAPSKWASLKSSLSSVSSMLLGPAGIAGAALGAAYAVKRLAGDFMESASQMVDLSAKTGMSTASLQKLKFAAEQTGTSLDAMTNAVSMMQDRIGSNDKSAKKAIDNLGLSFAELKRLKPEEAFDKIMRALDGVENVNERVSMSKDIFGKAGAEVLKLSGQYAELTAKAEELGIVLDEDTLKAADSLGDQFDILKSQFSALIGKALTPILPLIIQVAQAFGSLASAIAPVAKFLVEGIQRAFLAVAITIDKFLLGLIEAGQKIPILGKHLGVLNGATTWLKNDLKNATAAFDTIGKTLPKTGSAAADTAGKFKGFNDELGETTKKAGDADKAIALLSTHLAALNPVVPLTLTSGKGGGMFGGLFGGGTIPLANAGALMGGTVPGSGGFGGFSSLFGGQKPQNLAPGFFSTSTAPPAQDITNGLGFMPGAPVDVLGPKPPGLFSGIFGSGFGGQLGSTILSAFTGGGDIGKSIGGLLGGEAVKSIGSTVARSLGGTLGAAFGSVIPGLGTMLGGLVGGLFGKLFGGDAKKTREMRDAFLAQAGGLDQVRKMAEYAGVSVDKLLSTKKSKEFEKEVKKLEAAFKATQERVAKLADELGKLSATGGLLGGDLARRLTADLDKPEVQGAFASFVSANLDAAAKGMSAFLAASKDLPITASSAEALGAALGGVFARMRDMGASLPEALAALGPAVDALQARLTAAGLSGGEAFDELREMSALAAGEITGPLLSGVDGLTQGMVGLANANLLTDKTFAGLSEQVGATFDRLVEQGVAGDAAIRAIGPSLQRLYELQQKYGFEVDANTAKLLEMGQEQGVVGEAMKDTQTQILDVLKLIAQALGADIPKAAERAGQAFEEMGRKIPSVPGDLVGFTDERVGGLAHSGAYVAAQGLRRFHSGGLASDELLAVLQSGEAVLNRRAVSKLGAGLVARLNKSEVSPGGGDAGLAALAGELAALREEQASASAALPAMLARAVRDAVLTAGR